MVKQCSDFKEKEMDKTFKEIRIEAVSRELTETITRQFDLLKDDYKLTYENDFKAFSLGYTIGVCGAIKRVKTTNMEEENE